MPAKFKNTLLIFISIICLIGIGVTAFYAGTVDKNLDKSKTEVETLKKEVADLKSQSAMTNQTTSPNSTSDTSNKTSSSNTKTYSNANLPDLKFDYDQNIVLTETLSSQFTDPSYQQYKYPQIKLNADSSTLNIDTILPEGLGGTGFSLILDQDFKQINDKYGRIKFRDEWIYAPLSLNSTAGIITKNNPKFEENYALTYIKDSPTYIEGSLKLKPQVAALYSGTEGFLSSKTTYTLPKNTTDTFGNTLYIKISTTATSNSDLAKFDEVIKTLKY